MNTQSKLQRSLSREQSADMHRTGATGMRWGHRILVLLLCIATGTVLSVDVQAQTVTGSKLSITSTDHTLGTFRSSYHWGLVTVENGAEYGAIAQIKADRNQVEIGARSSHDLLFSAGNNLPHMMIKTDGKVGIGVLNPNAKLDVNGNSHMNGHISLSAGNGRGLRFWNSDSYKIHMGNGTEYHYGPVTDYSIKMNMNNQANRGWVWGVDGQAPAAAINTQGNMKLKGSLEVEGSFIGDGSQLTGVQGNFGQLDIHGVFTDFNTPVEKWGWNFVKGTTNAPNTNSSQWYRFIGSIGSNYAINDFHIEIAYPRFNYATAGVWMRTIENKVPQTWVQINGGGGASLSDITSKDGQTYEFGAASNATTGVSVRATSNPAAGDNIFSVEPSGAQARFGVTQSNGGWFRDGLSIGVQYNSAMPAMGTGLFVTGDVTFGQATAKKKLTMHGDIVASRIAVASDPANFTAWPDYVFAQDYDLPALEEVEAYIKEKKHLPEVPSAEEVATEGFDLGDMDATLLKKVEELTLYIIEQNKKLEKQNQQVAEQNAQLLKQNARIEQLEARITDQD